MIHNVLTSLVLPFSLKKQNLKFLTVRTCAQLLSTIQLVKFPYIKILNQGSTDSLKFWISVNLVPGILLYVRRNILQRATEASADCQRVHDKSRFINLVDQGSQGLWESLPWGTPKDAMIIPAGNDTLSGGNIRKGKKAGFQVRPRRHCSS